ncbi:hypothetical protein Ais01nite_30090 [Asanoa ishikariensis]|uniref:Uncharacterized protein n=1 Tax=Asanoa ishikariensis TaxID=137265 RepID=A0A1H3QK24_9ACTN|nr:hypothetical protein [Asanoa ishikariensis]GIF64974.1 hypothetical protein Ais01nite_30090 [Asanoa ishikariensis]SDZ13378.1 hypothetical protein SAMN05421684_2913 [Asanoa ishikariensis]
MANAWIPVIGGPQDGTQIEVPITDGLPPSPLTHEWRWTGPGGEKKVTETYVADDAPGSDPPWRYVPEH